MAEINTFSRDPAFLAAYERLKDASPEDIVKDCDLKQIAEKHKVFVRSVRYKEIERGTDSMRRVEEKATYRSTEREKVLVYGPSDFTHGYLIQDCYAMGKPR